MKSALASRISGAAANKAASAFEVNYAKLCLRLFPKTRFRIYKMLARLMEAEIDARTALEFIYDVVSKDGRKAGEPEAIAVSHWLRAYRESGQLSEAVTGWVPQTEVLLLEAGERGGQFQRALEVMLRLNDRMGSIRGKIFGKLSYPLAMFVLLSGIIYYLATDFMPALAAMKPDGVWTGTGATFVAFLSWAKSWLFWSMAGFAALVVAVFATLPIFRGPVRNVLDFLPPWSVHRFTSGTSFLTALLVLMESGRGLLDAISLVRPNVSPYLTEKIERIETGVREGRDFGSALAMSDDQFPDAALVKEIQIYAHIGRLDQGLISVVEQWMESATARATAQISLLGGAVLFALFATIGFVMTGLFDVMTQLKQGY